MQTSKTYKIVLKKSLLKRVSSNILLIKQSYACLLIDKNNILSTKLILHLFALLNNYNCKKKINNCSKYYRYIEKLKYKLRLKVYLFINKGNTIV